jgi:hypothetical protein
VQKEKKQWKNDNNNVLHDNITKKKILICVLMSAVTIAISQEKKKKPMGKNVRCVSVHDLGKTARLCGGTCRTS